MDEITESIIWVQSSILLICELDRAWTQDFRMSNPLIYSNPEIPTMIG